MTSNRNIYIKIWEYLLEQKAEDNILKKNQTKIASILKENKPINLDDIEVNIDDWNEWSIDISLTEIIINSITERIQNDIENNLKITQDIEKLTTQHIQSVLKDIINDLKSEIWTEIYNNTNEINEWLAIKTYIEKYAENSIDHIIKSGENFLDYIAIKYTAYQAIENILLAECEKKTLWENIKEYLYEDIWMYWEKMIYNIVSEYMQWKEIYKKIFNIIEKNTFNTKIIHYILKDKDTIEWVQKRSKNAQNYIKYNYEHIIKCIDNQQWIEHKIINKYAYNKEIQRFIVENMDTIHNLIIQMKTWSTIKNINLLNNLFDTIIDDKFVINLQELKKYKSYPTN